MQKAQRDYFLRKQMEAIKRELGEEDAQAAEIGELDERIGAAEMTPEAEKEARRELDRMRRMPVQAAEYTVIKTYLDWMVSLPWQQRTQDNLDVEHARQVLDEDHYGLGDIKDRITEFLAVRKLRSDRKEERDADESPRDAIRREREGVILCFVGPPGVGKTSLGLSIARAMNRKFVRLALGGIRDEAEIRGFRRTYIGSMPGRVIQSLRRVESRNPVFMLDEVDKLGAIFAATPVALCWRFWIPNKTPSSAITISTSPSICLRSSLSRRQTGDPFRRRSVIGWRLSSSPAIQIGKGKHCRRLSGTSTGTRKRTAPGRD